MSHTTASPGKTARLRSSDGVLPIPVPATVELLKNAPVYSSGIQAELVTPTGAAIVNVLAKRFGSFPEMKIENTGYGAGGRDLWLERLHQHAVGAGLTSLVRVDRLERAGQQDDRDVRERRRLLDERGDRVAIALRHADIGQHNVGRLAFDPLDRLTSVGDGDDPDTGVSKRELDDATNGQAVVRQQQRCRPRH